MQSEDGKLYVRRGVRVKGRALNFISKPRIFRMGTDDPSSLGLAEKKQKTGKPACRVVVFVLPHSRRECSRAHPFLSVFIWVIRGYLKLSLCLCGSVRGGFSGVHSEARIHGSFVVQAITTCVGSLSNPERWFAGA